MATGAEPTRAPDEAIMAHLRAATAGSAAQLAALLSASATPEEAAAAGAALAAQLAAANAGNIIGGVAPVTAPSVQEGSTLEKSGQGVSKIEAFLASIGLQAYLPIFIENGFDTMTAVQAMDEQEMREDIGMAEDHIQILLQKLARGDSVTVMAPPLEVDFLSAHGPIPSATAATPSVPSVLPTAGMILAMPVPSLPVPSLPMASMPVASMPVAPVMPAPSPPVRHQVPPGILAMRRRMAAASGAPPPPPQVPPPPIPPPAPDLSLFQTSPASQVLGSTIGFPPLAGAADNSLEALLQTLQAPPLPPVQPIQPMLQMLDLPMSLPGVTSLGGCGGDAIGGLLLDSAQTSPMMMPPLLAPGGATSTTDNALFALAQLAEESAQMVASASTFCSSPQDLTQVASVAEAAESAMERAKWAAKMVDGMGPPEPQLDEWLTLMRRITSTTAEVAERAFDTCRLARDKVEELMPGTVDKKSKVPCRFYLQTGTCRDGAACRLSHDPKDQKPRPLMLKRQELCKFFDQGQCIRGAACAWAHGTEELDEITKYVSKLRQEKDRLKRTGGQQVR